MSKAVVLAFAKIQLEAAWRCHRSDSTLTNNAGKFDLWIEFKRCGRGVTIGNWKEVP
jgi:hypothetical protein